MSFTAWIRRLTPGTKRASRTSRPAARSRNYHPCLECLEDRSLLSAFASIQGELTTPQEKDVIPINISAADFTLHRWGMYLGFELHVQDGNRFSPSRIQFQTRGKAQAIIPWHSAVSSQHGSVTLATVRPGNFQLIVGGDHRSTGGYRIDVFLVGNANGDSRVDKRDVNLIQALRGKRLGKPGYVRDADANRDGVINAADEGLARANRGAATRIRRLTLSASIDPASLPAGVQPGAHAAVTIDGQTLPNAKVKLDQGADGSFDLTGTADGQGHFRFTPSVSAGTTQFQVLALGPFSQRRTTDFAAVLPLETPGQLQPTLDKAHVATAVISEAGGTLGTTAEDGTSYSLAIPPGALVGGHTILLTPIASIQNLQLSGGLVAGVQFGPDGLQFSTPTTLTIDLPADLDSNTIDTLLGFTYEGDGQNFRVIPIQTVGRTLIFEVSHFSGAGAATGTPLEIFYVPLIRQADQQVANVVCAGGLIPDRCDSEDDTALLLQRLKAAEISVLQTWFISGVQPLLDVSASSNAGLDHALKEFFVWQANAVGDLCDRTTGDCSEFFDPLTFDDNAEPTLATALTAGINRDGDAALANPSDANLRRLIHIAVVAQFRTFEDQAQLALQKLDGGFRALLAEGKQRCVTDVVAGETELRRALRSPFIEKIGDALQQDFITAINNCGNIVVHPDDTNVPAGGQVQFAATATGLLNSSVTWEVVPSGAGTITEDGLFTAGSGTGTVHIKATSVASPDKFATTSIAIGDLAVEPAAAILQPGASSQFSAAVNGMTNTGVIWSATGGSITPSGVFTAADTPGSFVVRATSLAGAAVFATATVTVVANATSIGVSPSDANILVGGTQQFTAAVTGLTNQNVTWSATGGTITPTGLYTAGTTAGTFQVTATSVADPSQSAQATTHVVAPLAFTGSGQRTFLSPDILPITFNDPLFGFQPTLPFRLTIDLTGSVTLFFHSTGVNGCTLFICGVELKIISAPPFLPSFHAGNPDARFRFFDINGTVQGDTFTGTVEFNSLNSFVTGLHHEATYQVTLSASS